MNASGLPVDRRPLGKAENTGFENLGFENLSFGVMMAWMDDQGKIFELMRRSWSRGFGMFCCVIATSLLLIRKSVHNCAQNTEIIR
jgi:hypothetical protein